MTRFKVAGYKRWNVFVSSGWSRTERSSGSSRSTCRFTSVCLWMCMNVCWAQYWSVCIVCVSQGPTGAQGAPGDMGEPGPMVRDTKNIEKENAGEYFETSNSEDVTDCVCVGLLRAEGTWWSCGETGTWCKFTSHSWHELSERFPSSHVLCVTGRARTIWKYRRTRIPRLSGEFI